MAEFRTNPDTGETEVRLAGSRRWKAVTPEEAEAYGMGRGERMLHSFLRGAGQIDEGGALLRSKIMEGLLGQEVGMPEGTTRDQYQAEREAAAAALARQSAAMARVDPRAGLTAYAPEIGAGIGTAVATGGMSLPAQIGAEAALGAGLGAALDYENPGRGALVGGALGGGAMAAGPALRGIGRGAASLPGRGVQRGLDAADAVIERYTGRADITGRMARAETRAATTATERRSIGAAVNPDAPPSQRPLEGFLTADDAEAIGLRLTRGDRMALDASTREAFELAAERRSREELMRSQELGGTSITKIEETRQQQEAWLTSRIAQELGDPSATNLTPAARQRIRGDVQDVFKKYFDEGNAATLADFNESDLAKLQDVVDVASPNAERQVALQLETIEAAIKQADELPETTQRQFMAEKRSDLADKAEKAFAAGNYELGSSLSQMREVVEDVLQRQYSGDQVAQTAIQDARKRWRILKALERTNATDPAGDINVRSFLNAYKAVTPRYKRLTRGGRGDLESELETLNWLVTKVQPDSGTAQRLIAMMSNPRTLGGGGLAYLGGQQLFGN